jgi:hypothetical protein
MAVELYKTMAVSCLMHGIETWALRRTDRKTTGSSRDAVSMECGRLYSMEQRKQRLNMAVTRDEGGQRDTRKEDILAGTCAEDAFRKS